VNEDSNDDVAFESGLAASTDERWHEFFGWDITRPDFTDDAPGFGRWCELAYDLGMVQPYPWREWVDADGKPFFDSRDLSECSLADAIRIVTAIVRSDRFNEGHLVAEMGNGLVTAAVRRIWKWYQSAVGNNAGFVDASCYSDDQVYRWSYERRWGIGGSLCWIGLNPGTGDTDGKKRPTLAKVCRWAASLGLESVVVVNLFAYRSTDPQALQTVGVDIVGDLNDEAIRSAVERSAVTLAAWGGGGKINDRGRDVAARYDTLMCLGITSDGEPRHPLYVPQATEPGLYRRPPV
jgi:hypothetical protein